MNDKPDALSETPPSDDFAIRCPRLGHQINFAYCRRENSGLPCFKTLDCWYSYFNVHDFFQNQLSSSEFEKIFIQRGEPKISSLLNLIEKTKAKKGKND